METCRGGHEGDLTGYPQITQMGWGRNHEGHEGDAAGFHRKGAKGRRNHVGRPRVAARRAADLLTPLTNIQQPTANGQRPMAGRLRLVLEVGADAVEHAGGRGVVGEADGVLDGAGVGVAVGDHDDAVDAEQGTPP